MIARLQRFYGGDPRGWLRIPLVLVRSFLENMPGVEAGDALLQTTIAQIGSGNVKKNDVQRQTKKWQRLAHGGPRVIRAASEEEKIAMLQGAGIQVG